MSAALRAREALALARLGNALGVRLDPDKVNAVLLEELADAAEAILEELADAAEAILGSSEVQADTRSPLGGE